MAAELEFQVSEVQGLEINLQSPVALLLFKLCSSAAELMVPHCGL